MRPIHFGRYRPHDAYSEDALRMRELLRARSSAATWKPESKAGFANPGPNKVSQPEVILRRGRVFPIGEASSAPEKKSDQEGVTPRSVLRESQNVAPSAVRCLTSPGLPRATA